MVAQDEFTEVASRWEAAGLSDTDGLLALGTLLRAHAVVTSSVDGALRASNLSRTGYLVLATLLLAKNGTRGHGRLARDLLVHPTTISLVTDQLVRDGLVRRASDPLDRRTTLSTITPKGKKLVTKATQTLASIGFGFGEDADFGEVLGALKVVSSAPRAAVPHHRSRARRLKSIGEATS